MIISRRTFLRSLAASTAIATIGLHLSSEPKFESRKQYRAVPTTEERAPGKWYLTGLDVHGNVVHEAIDMLPLSDVEIRRKIIMLPSRHAMSQHAAVWPAWAYPTN